MDINLLRKRLKELQENFKAGNIASELPGMENTYQPIYQDTTGTNNAPEIVEPTIPIYEPEEDDFNMPAAVPAVNTASQSANSPATAPKMGQNGSKALDEILPDVPEHYKEERSKALTDAYNAGLNGLDITQEIRADAAVGGYLEQIEAMYNAGLQDMKPFDSAAVNTPSVDNSKVNKPSVNIPSVNIPENSVPRGVDNLENLSYTSGNTTGNPGTDKNTDDLVVPNMGDVTPITTPQWEQDYNYIMDMLFLNGVESSGDPSAQLAYQWLTNYENRGIKIPAEIMEAYENFINGIGDYRIKHSHKVAMGDADINNFTYDELKTRNDTRLDVPTDPREGGTWCWAAVMSTVDKYYNGDEGKNQEYLVDHAKKADPDAKQFGARDCENFVNFNLDKKVDGAPSYETIEANMRTGQPIVLWNDSGTSQHFVVITGCYVKNGVKYIIINENRDGQQYPVSYNDLKNSFTTCKNSQRIKGYYTTSKK